MLDASLPSSVTDVRPFKVMLFTRGLLGMVDLDVSQKATYKLLPNFPSPPLTFNPRHPPPELGMGSRQPSQNEVLVRVSVPNLLQNVILLAVQPGKERHHPR